MVKQLLAHWKVRSAMTKINKKVVSWSIKVEYEDGTTEEIADVPNFVSSVVDDWLTEKEVSNDTDK